MQEETNETNNVDTPRDTLVEVKIRLLTDMVGEVVYKKLLARDYIHALEVAKKVLNGVHGWFIQNARNAHVTRRDMDHFKTTGEAAILAIEHERTLSQATNARLNQLLDTYYDAFRTIEPFYERETGIREAFIAFTEELMQGEPFTSFPH